ncbi:hypothetical protein A2291_00435 [candidate division WOR-1 bacterium RIFOXYB2_FULL_42_35]|uniref:Type I restriction modification DNA specificity domain-containing protein n=1 Tax=candidate division WOR-1 bacterium RIFOXYC2_FULL_41_25 TaxID=1802586 RepID=A0A1F4TPD1_UNCSA|nr:MAG: hypothetical protein A2291_00435 [candidate division WOR-1 bacterium RIFOXYB2_FULL_42_35]OGC34400.1 MAG: hypothetical protein A2462_00870 [candidate division WOR-1 bacterium RIFOXYC2_FULL_41_25]
MKRNKANFKKVKIKDIAKINPDSIGRNYEQEKIEYVDISNVGSGNMIQTQEMNIQDAPSRAKRLVKSGDIILSTVRPNRRSFFYFRSPKENTVISTGFAVLRALENSDPKYLYYSVTNQTFTDYLTSNAKGAAYPAVDADIIYDGEVFVPKKKEDQSRIASVLSTYDDLIENNEKRIKILEEMAQRLYTEWFVKFKFPPRLRASTSSALRSGQAGHEKVKMVDSGTEYGKIPEGWGVKTLKNIVNVISGYAFKSSDFQETGIPVIKIKNITSSNAVDTQNVDFVSPVLATDKLAKYFLKDGDMIVAMTGATAGKVGRMSAHQTMLLNQRVAKIDPNSGYYSFVWGRIGTEEAKNELYRLAGGSAQPNMSAGQIENITLLVPVRNIVLEYERLAFPVLQKILLLQKRNKNLSKIRDLLIPQLVTGKRGLKA